MKKKKKKKNMNTTERENETSFVIIIQIFLYNTDTRANFYQHAHTKDNVLFVLIQNLGNDACADGSPAFSQCES